MRRASLLLLLPALTLGISACNRIPQLEVRTFNLEHRSGYEAAELVEPYVFRDREGAPGTMSATPDAVSVRETPDNLDRIGQVLADFDRAIPAVQLRFQLIEADSFQEADPAIAEVVQQLQELFRFDGYRLVGEAMVAVGGGSMDRQEFRQRVLGTNEEFSINGEAAVQRPGVVRLDGLRLWQGGNDVLLETSVNVSAGQTVVIGGTRARVGGRSFILTVTAASD